MGFLVKSCDMQWWRMLSGHVSNEHGGHRPHSVVLSRERSCDMRLGPGTLSAGLIMLSLTGTATAHHPIEDTYDLSKTVTLNGVISRVEWVNPHARLYVDVRRGDGTTMTWLVELGPPNTYRRKGLEIGALTAGAPVVVDAWPARDGSQSGSIRALMLSDGRTFSNGPPMWTRQSNR